VRREGAAAVVQIREDRRTVGAVGHRGIGLRGVLLIRRGTITPGLPAILAEVIRRGVAAEAGVVSAPDNPIGVGGVDCNRGFVLVEAAGILIGANVPTRRTIAALRLRSGLEANHRLGIWNVAIRFRLKIRLCGSFRHRCHLRDLMPMHRPASSGQPQAHHHPEQPRILHRHLSVSRSKPPPNLRTPQWGQALFLQV
jgi:hypothetical protein